MKAVYGPSNERHFSVEDMLTNINRFSMRSLKGIRKNDNPKTVENLVIALSWFIGLMNQLSIYLDQCIWRRFPYVCSYCAHCPCVCKAKKVKKRVNIKVHEENRPKTIHDIQKMFGKIYVQTHRTLEHEGIHFAEEVGELSEDVMQFRGHHTEKDFAQIELEASDLWSCAMGVFNALDVDYQNSLVSKFDSGCHICKHAPCTCKYDFVLNFKS